MRTQRFVTGITLLMVLALGMTGIAAAQDEASARPWIGIGIADSDAGVVISQIAPDSPAAASDLAVDDVIVSLNGDDVETASALVETLQAFAPEDTVTLGVLRGDESLDIDITLGEFPEDMDTSPVRPGNRDNVQIIGRASVLPMLGVTFEEVDEGWQVTRVLPMATADFQEGDIITEINGQAVGDVDFQALIESLMNEDSVEVTVLRDGEEITFQVESVMGMGMNALGIPGPAAGRVLLGVQYQMLDEAFAANLGIETSDGALITQVLPDTPAANAELMAGDIVTAVNDTTLDSETTLAAALADFEDGDTVTLTVMRAGEEMSLDVTLESQPGFNNRFFEFNQDGNGFRVAPVPGGRNGQNGQNGRGFGFGRDGQDGRGFGFRFGDDNGRGFDFRFDGEDMGDFFRRFEGVGTFGVTCQNSDGDTVFSFEFNGQDGFSIDNFELPDMDSGIDIRDLDCQINSDTPNAVPDASTNNGDL